jgi:hypothetical protein
VGVGDWDEEAMRALAQKDERIKALGWGGCVSDELDARAPVNELDARVSVIVIDSLDAVATLDETKTDVATLDEAKTDAFVHMHQVFMTTLARREGESRESCFVRLFRASRRGCRLDYTP